MLDKLQERVCRCKHDLQLLPEENGSRVCINFTDYRFVYKGNDIFFMMTFNISYDHHDPFIDRGEYGARSNNIYLSEEFYLKVQEIVESYDGNIEWNSKCKVGYIYIDTKCRGEAASKI